MTELDYIDETLDELRFLLDSVINRTDEEALKNEIEYLRQRKIVVEAQ